MDWYMDLLQQIERLQDAVRKLAEWQEFDTSDLYEDGYLQIGDLE